MVKEQYLKYRAQNNLGEIMYSFYKESCVEKSLKEHTKQKFLQAMQIYQLQNRTALSNVLNHYDIKFGIVLLEGEEKNIIKVF